MWYVQETRALTVYDTRSTAVSTRSNAQQYIALPVASRDFGNGPR